jgi:hypothetical protein
MGDKKERTRRAGDSVGPLGRLEVNVLAGLSLRQESCEIC